MKIIKMKLLKNRALIKIEKMRIILIKILIKIYAKDFYFVNYIKNIFYLYILNIIYLNLTLI